ncbi:MAG: hypothetical protein KDA86_19670 [Planctomycetaceae bacterium]|nr:hypothetical protein [Planctomycetaceae bacterium]
MESVEEQNVAPSTAAREAYFVDFALAMREKVNLPLMVTGRFRTRAAMDYAIESGAADVIGIARPLCYVTDGPLQLLNGLTELPRKEEDLALIPSSLGFLKRLQLLKAVDNFAAIYWFYAQLYSLGRTGRTNPGLSVFAALREVEGTHKRLLAARARSRC